MPFKNQHPLYSAWKSMRQRCLNPEAKQFSDYGGRGITVCARWGGADGFKSFVSDMGPRPEGYTLDRRNNDLGYSPENCRWATRKEQQRNRRGSIYLLIDGHEHLLADLAERTGMKPDTIVNRHRQGLGLQAILSSERRVFTAGLALGGRASGDAKLARTHCKQGHEFTAGNTLTYSGRRQCRACHNEKMRNYAAAKRILD